MKTLIISAALFLAFALSPQAAGFQISLKSINNSPVEFKLQSGNTVLQSDVNGTLSISEEQAKTCENLTFSLVLVSINARQVYARHLFLENDDKSMFIDRDGITFAKLAQDKDRIFYLMLKGLKLLPGQEVK